MLHAGNISRRNSEATVESVMRRFLMPCSPVTRTQLVTVGIRTTSDLSHRIQNIVYLWEKAYFNCFGWNVFQTVLTGDSERGWGSRPLPQCHPPGQPRP